MVRTTATRKALGAAAVLGSAFFVPGLWSSTVVTQAQPSQVRFATHVIGGDVPGGYQVTAVDLNKDGKLDLLGLGLSRAGDLVWFENPTWTRRVMATGIVNMVNLAPYDVDGDGIPEIGIAHGFATSIANSPGGVSLLTHGPNVSEPWTRKDIDALPTTHRLRWVNADGQKKVMLVNAPLIGPTAKATDDHAKNAIVYYEAPDWKRQTITEDEEGVIHGILPTSLAPFGGARGAESLLSASFLGIFQHRWQDGKWVRTRVAAGSAAAWPKSGSSDIAVGRHGTANVMSAIEPWHGNEVVMYRQDGSAWVRQLLDDQITDGHALAMADFAGDGRSAIVAGERGGKRSVYVYWPPATLGDAWTKHVVDDAMNASGCVTADLNGDKRPDIACIAGGTTGVKWYENLGR
jgi:hypothetical protein